MSRDITRLVHLFFEAGMLRTTMRSHYRRLFSTDRSDNIAAHSFRAAIISWFLAKLEGEDPWRVFVMTALHDFPEARTGDMDWVQKSYVFEEDGKAAKDQFGSVLHADELLELLLEYQEGESLAAQIAEDADHLDQLLLEMEHTHMGLREAALWLHLDDFEGKCHLYRGLNTESARILAKEIVSQTPSDWWKNLWRRDKRKFNNKE